MTILLIDPFTFKRNLPGLSQSILSLYPVLNEAGYDVKVLNNFNKKDLIGMLTNNDIQFVGITTSISKHLLDALMISEIVKKFGVPIFWGGPYPTLLPGQALQNSCVDGVVIGEGEKTIVDLARSIKNDLSLKKVKGIAFKENGNIIKTPSRKPIENLDELPLPPWKLIDEFPKHHFFRNQKFAYIETSRGCPYNCGFCFKQFGAKWRPKTSERILEEIQILNDMGISCINFLDDNFLIQRKRVVTLCKKIIQEKIDVQWILRGGRVDLVDKELLQCMKKSGCINISFGVESGSQRILNIINKGITVNQIVKAFDLCHKVGITSNALLMTDIPTETKNDLNETLKIIKKIQPATCTLSFYLPLPKTKMYLLAIKHGFVEPENTIEWSSIDMSHTLYGLSDINSLLLKIIAKWVHFNYVYMPLFNMFKKTELINLIKTALTCFKRSKIFSE